MKILAKSPTRVDLSGGTFDIWPIYLHFPGAMTINFAIDQFSYAQLETRSDQKILLQAKDIHIDEIFSSAEDLASNIQQSKLPLLAKTALFFKIPSGFTLTTWTDLPLGSGLAASSSLLISLCTLFNRLIPNRYSNDQLIHIAKNIESTVISTPTGIQDYFPALYGNVLCINLDLANIWHEVIQCDHQELENHVLLCYTGDSHQSGMQNWDVMKRFYDHDSDVFNSFQAIRDIAQQTKKCLQTGNIPQLADFLNQEWQQRKILSNKISTEKINKLQQIAHQAGSLGTKICGAGGGGVIAFIVDPSKRDEIKQALQEAGGEIIPCKINQTGTQIEQFD